MKRILIPVLLLLFFCFNSNAQDTWRLKVAPNVLNIHNSNNNLDLLVEFSAKADLTEAKFIQGKHQKARFVFDALSNTAQISQKNLIQWSLLHHFKHQSFYIVNAMRIQMPASFLPELAAMNEIKYISNNGVLTYTKPVEEYFNNQRGPSSIEWGIDMINANDVWALGYKGEGVVVGGEDTGYDWLHPALQNNYRGWDGINADHNYNWHDAIHELSPLNGDTTSNPANNPCGIDIKEPCDDVNHGTHTMGTMIGYTPGDTIGVAPAAKWIGVRNMERGWGKPSTYIEGFEWFMAPTDLDNLNPDPDKSPDVINNSWGCPPKEGCDISNFHIMHDVVANLKASGVVVVVSAGNSGSNCETVSDPAAMFEESFSVGATRSNDTIANFSSRGAVSIDSSFRLKPNVSAPGVSVRSSIPGGGYASFSGTSMAGPHVVGAVALILCAAPELKGSVDIIENILEQTAVPKTSDQDCNGVLGTSVPNNIYGYGRIDVLKAVEMALQTVSTQNQANNYAVKVFPNPVKDVLYISVPKYSGEVQIEIYDAIGKIIYKKLDKVSGGSLINCQLGNTTSGMFFYKIVGENLQLTGKFLKI